MDSECAVCVHRSSYTANQHARGPGLWRCVHCHYSDASCARQPDGGRFNNSTTAVVTRSALERPFAQGAFRWVAKGRYSSGPRQGQACVFKWFKAGSVFSQDYFNLDMKGVDKALEFVNTFNQMGIINKVIKINVPQVWQFNHSSDSEWSGQKVLCEPFIQNYQKFNSNSGWHTETRAWGEVMQALSHFSYHLSAGDFVLCDLQGGIYQHEVVLSDPVILSRDRQYGVTDLGPDGISSFFAQHYCNNYCHRSWTRPGSTLQYFRPVPGTTMIQRSVGTEYSRPYRTRFYG
ncbi:MHCK/EF2 kinase [Metarhizium album ARSEF 1941]|uniref:MHCK/EF2 kinase n=1 Tax=Metarhizium album (strain ARSEF 1941) TaxID=1081103 RepID=A0A0B2WYJ7_METAS|nr:MHCK/EF2 kinase [Metarhizium album ARSEF 1941]KHO01337.1 MHCK/EF2 kinase [Metarhizium album ARSEF 1941]